MNRGEGQTLQERFENYIGARIDGFVEAYSDYYDDEVEARGGIRSVGRFFLLAIAWVLRLCALVGSLLVVLNSFYATAWHPSFVRLMDQVWHYVPWGRAGTLVVNTPFGGKFYGGLALIVLAWFVLDWILCRLRAALR